MGRRSKISRLPPEIREEIGRLTDAGNSLDAILAKLREMDVADVSRSALGRHVQKMERVGVRLRQSRMMAEALAGKLGDQPGDQVARLNIELIHNLIHEVVTASEEAEGGEEAAAMKAMLQNPKALALFAEATERLTKASRHNAEFVKQLEDRAAARARREAATRAEGVARELGLTQETATLFKRRMLGIAGPPAAPAPPSATPDPTAPSP